MTSVRSPSRAFGAVYRIPYDGVAAEMPTKHIVGSKAHNLMVMAQQGLPVPPGFVFGVDLCRAFLDGADAALDGLEEPLTQELDQLGALLGRRFGDARKPLLVSVRSGAAASMPGMMETVLNVGLTAQAVRGLIRLTGNPRFAYDCRRRLIQQFAEVVRHADARPFERLVADKLRAEGLDDAGRLGSEAMAEIAAASLEAFETACRRSVSGRSARTAPRHDPGGSRLLVGRAGGRLPARQRDRRSRWHRGDRAGHGVRQFRRAFWFGRRLHP